MATPSSPSSLSEPPSGLLPAPVLEYRLRQAVREVISEGISVPLTVRPCADPRFGDYQASGLMGAAKSLRRAPRELAQQVLAHLDVKEWCETVEVAGAGFLNFRLNRASLNRALQAALRGEHLFYQQAARPRTIVVDFSSPNIAKPMHVGHIRSTVLGESLSRLLRLLGHNVITDNHIGDWGTQFGKLLVGWKRGVNLEALRARPLEEMERLYKSIHAACEADPAVLEQARQELVKLQQGDPENMTIWREMIALSKTEFEAVYRRLGVHFDATLGESFYNSRLADIVASLRKKDLARESEGATVVFFEDQPDLKRHPAIILKSDGGANYMTTDLATLDYRMETWSPDEIIYVTDARQQLHFRQLFAIFRRWLPEARVKLAHVWFGSILGEDQKPFKTRSGETVKLAELLDEAEERAARVVQEKNPELAEDQRREIARIVGIGAVKYADLLQNRQSDYVFNWEKLLALNGNTAPYLQYAYTRIRGIFKKLAAEGEDVSSGTTIVLEAPEEIRLAKHLLNFGLTLEAAAEDYRPNYLCEYLYDLAGRFAQFYEHCPVLKAEPAQRGSRLGLCELTGRVLKLGLETLGLETTDQM